MLEVIIGMIFTFMLLSLLGTTLNELISAWRGWRGLYLEEGLKRLLEYGSNKDAYEKFVNNPIFKQLSQHHVPGRASKAPAYISPQNFTSILTNVLKKKNEAVKEIDDLIVGLPEDSQLRQVLEQLKEEGHENVEAYKARLQNWFDDVMGQASGWYKRHLQWITLMVGVGIAATFNADSFQIYQHLNHNAAARERLVSLAENYVATRQGVQVPKLAMKADSLAGDSSKIDTKGTIQQVTESDEFAGLSNILGLGWQPGDTQVGPKRWAERILGWIVTALAISLGAPFWFDVLKKIITIRSSGATESGGGGTQVVINTGKDGSVEKKK